MSAKALRLAPIAKADADRVVRQFHYSGSVVRNSQLHLGVFLDGRVEGAMQFGPPIDKRKAHTLVRDTPWNGMLELNRMAFGPKLPRNSESRALAVALRMVRSTYPHVQWILSYADATQCGDGTIYRAAGFLLTAIKKNTAIWSAGGETVTDLTVRAGALDGSGKAGRIVNRVSLTIRPDGATGGGASMRAIREAGGAPLPGFQLRYIRFLDPTARERLAVPVLPYAAIEEHGAGMVRGQNTARVKRA